MNKRKIAIVRATDIIPYNGIINPLSNVPNLDSNISDFSYKIIPLLEKKGILKEASFRIIKEEIEERERIIKEYTPLSSNYNSVVLFSLNGLVPDDIESGFANNTFSNKNIAIIDDLDYHW